MRAVKLETTVPENRKLSLTVPPEIPPGPVEVLILSKESAEAQKSLLVFLDALASAPPSPRKPEEIEADIQAERNAWDE